MLIRILPKTKIQLIIYRREDSFITLSPATCSTSTVMWAPDLSRPPPHPFSRRPNLPGRKVAWEDETIGVGAVLRLFLKTRHPDASCHGKSPSRPRPLGRSRDRRPPSPPSAEKSWFRRRRQAHLSMASVNRVGKYQLCTIPYKDDFFNFFWFCQIII